MTCQCNHCCYATVCPNRAMFMKIFTHRNEVMVHIADETTGDIDLSTEVVLRVEHRYLDGPGLEKLYHDLGLSAPQYCCVLPLNRCAALDNHPYDDSWCNIANDPNHSLMNDCSGLRNVFDRSSKCKSCCNYQKLDPTNYAKLGGTVFSTFGINEVQATLGGKVAYADIPTPKTILPGYVRMHLETPNYTVNKEHDTLILYYVYSQNIETVKPNEYMTEDEITEKGLRTDVSFFYNELSYVYPSLRGGESGIEMNLILDGVRAGIGRIDENGNVIARPGDLLYFDKSKMSPIFLSTIFDEELRTKYSERINTEIGYNIEARADTTSMQRRLPEAIGTNSQVEPINISNGNYRCCKLAQKDTLIFRIIIPEEYILDQKLIGSMTYPSRTTIDCAASFVKDGYRTYVMQIQVPTTPIDFQVCMVRREKAIDVASYPQIDHFSNWNSSIISWAAKEVTAMNGDAPIKVYPPIAPRIWAAGVMPYDETPEYPTDCPGPNDIVRPMFRLLGYTKSIDGRYRHKPEIEILPTILATYPGQIFYLKAEECDIQDASRNNYGAMWEFDAPRVQNTIKALAPNTNITIQDDRYVPAIPVKMSAQAVSVWPMEHMEMKTTYDAIYATQQLVYDEKLFDENLMKLLMTIFDTSSEVTLSMYLCPYDAKSVRCGNSEMDTDANTAIPPVGIVEFTTPEGPSRYNPLQNYEINEATQYSTEHPNYIIINIYPNNEIGLNAFYQNFQTLVLELTVIPRPTDVTINMMPDWKENEPITAGLIRGFEFTNLLPKDIGKLDAVLDSDGKVILIGDAAPYYRPENVYTVPTVKCKVIRRFKGTDKPDAMESVILKKYGHTTFAIQPSEAEAFITNIQCNGIILMDMDEDFNAKFYHQMPEHFINGSNISAMIQPDETVDRKYTMNLIYIDLDIEIRIEESIDSQGNPDFCKRCRGYVETKQYPWMDWKPICRDYSPTKFAP